MNKYKYFKDLQKIAAAFISEPDKPLKYEYLNRNKNLRDVSYSSMQRGVRELERLGILRVTYSKGKPKGGKRVKKFSLIKRRINVFKIMFEIFREERFEELLTSEYTNYVIGRLSFDPRLRYY